MHELVYEKKELRRRLLAVRDRIPPAVRAAKSERIWRRLRTLPPYQGAGMVLFYVNIRSEVETRQMLAESLALGKRVAVPVVNARQHRLELSEVRDLKELVPGTMGIPEPRPDFLRPVAPGEIGLVLVPGVAFDRRGGRLGYGAGYYDELLGRCSPQTLKIGLAFAEQIVPEVPLEPWDQRLDLLITEEELILIRT